MSEPIPEAIPTSADPKSRRPVKRLRGANNATATQASEIENLMWDPDRPVDIPALTSDSKPKLAPPPDIVQNVQGSSAGAGSGEFHVYKASRRREYERLKMMDEEAQKETDNAKWEQDLDEKRRKEEEKTAKKRAMRNKRKSKAKEKDRTPVPESQDQKDGVKKPLQIPKLKRSEDEGDASGRDASPAVTTGDQSHATSQAEGGITIHDDD